MNIVAERIQSEFKTLFKRLLDEGTTLEFEQILERVTGYLEVSCPPETTQLLQQWYQDIAKHQFLSNLVDGEAFEELVFFGSAFITKDGQPQSPVVLSHEDFILAWTQLAFNHHIAWNHAHPFASFAVELNQTKTRVTLIHPCCTPDGQMRAFIRAHAKQLYPVEAFCPEHVASMLRQAVEQKRNILVVGATQSGKTTLMRSMLSSVQENEHVVILEDTHEIKRKAARTTMMLADPVDPKRSLSEYCAMALRMSPDRIVLGEIRSKEVVPLILAFNSGHRGGLSSLHADGVPDALERLTLLFHLYAEASQLPHDKVMELVCRNIDQVVLVRDKQVIEIATVIGSEQGRPLFESQWQRHLNHTPVTPDQDWWKKASGH